VSTDVQYLYQNQVNKSDRECGAGSR
jgi:hypothetical protein